MAVWEEYLKVDGWHSEYKSVENALRHYARRVRSERTRTNFCHILMHFCKFYNSDPDTLVDLAVEQVSKLCQDYTDSFKEKGYSIRTLNSMQSYLKTFFKENGFKNGR